MTIRTDMTAALDDAFAAFAESITYNGVSIQAVVDIGESPNQQAGEVMTEGQLTVKVADVANPGNLDTVIIGSNTWRVARIIQSDWHSHVLAIYNNKRPLPR